MCLDNSPHPETSENSRNSWTRISETEEDEEDLIRYCRREENELLQALLEKRTVDLNINYVEEGRDTALNISASLGNLTAVKILLSREEIDVNQAGQERITALTEACLYGHVEIVKLLLTCPDVDINVVDCFDGTALQSAIMSGQTEIIKMILERQDLQIDQESFPAYLTKLPPTFLPILIQHLIRSGAVRFRSCWNTEPAIVNTILAAGLKPTPEDLGSMEPELQELTREALSSPLSLENLARNLVRRQLLIVTAGRNIALITKLLEDQIEFRIDSALPRIFL